MCLLGTIPISAGFSALESCETDVLTNVTVLAVYVSQINDWLIDTTLWLICSAPTSSSTETLTD